MFQKGLKGVVAVQTSISSVDGDKGELRYRGKLVDEVIKGKSFEETAHFLWHGKSRDSVELEEWKASFLKFRKVPEHIVEIAKLLPKEASIMDGLRTLISAYSSQAFSRIPSEQQALSLVSVFPVLTALLYRLQQGLPIIEPRDDLNHTANYLWMLRGTEPTVAQIEALETYLKLSMEHGMNASTFAARVTVSTESDMVSALTSAIGTMKGPLHGGAPSGVINLLEEIQSPERIELVIKNKLDRGEKIMGFGHRVYRTEDPRSILLRNACLALEGEDAWLDLAVSAEQEIIRLLNERKPGRALYTNVEFYAAAIMRSIDMPPALFTPTFSVARIVGWTAHVLEQQRDNVIFRPQSEYIGN
ncbi:Citrate synthase 1 [Planococcus massiliensis]|uniref:Citrate synthase n=1 Tax=Planococcus massiliensis TaxID=1499687 RepID=A0A098ERF9_9BACL|nr:citrate synthase/methylcitrate synthase [Planococcus massiliensis]CEG24387.1 Citrate synthase 1 [Planococcus massiliensis]